MSSSMQITLSVLGLLNFSVAFFASAREQGSNWFKLALSCQIVLLVPGATGAFESLQSASAAQLFLFVCSVLGCIGCTALVCQIKAGGWRVQGQLPASSSESTER